MNEIPKRLMRLADEVERSGSFIDTILEAQLGKEHGGRAKATGLRRVAGELREIASGIVTAAMLEQVGAKGRKR